MTNPASLQRSFVNRQAFTFTHNRDGEKLRLPERLLLAVCRPIDAPALSVKTYSYTLDNALDYAKKMIPQFVERIKGRPCWIMGAVPDGRLWRCGRRCEARPCHRY